MEQDAGHDDVVHAEYPHPKIWTNNLRDIVRDFENEPGLKKLASKLKSYGSLILSSRSLVIRSSLAGGELVSPSDLASTVKGGEILKRHVPVGHHIRVHKIEDPAVARQSGKEGPFYTADGGKTVASDATSAIVGAFNRGNTLATIEPPEEKLLTFKNPDAIADLQEAHQSSSEGLIRILRRAGENLAWRLENYNRMKAADIHNVHELKSALREYLPLKKGADKEDPIKKAETRFSR